MKRRDFLKLGALGAGLGVVATASASSFEITTETLDVSHIPVVIPDLAPDLIGKKIAFITDLHYGPASSPEWIEKIFATVQESKVDLVLFGGDYPWIPESSIAKGLLRERNRTLAEIPRNELASAIYDLFRGYLLQLPKGAAVFGNHDRWINPDLCEQAFKDSPTALLVNQWEEFLYGDGRIAVYGIDDYWTGFPVAPKKQPDTKATVTIGLCHNPDYLRTLLNQSRNCFDLILCGHTHGGQICLPGGKPLLVNLRDTRFGSGLKMEDKTTIYTSRGLGVVEVPYRINCPAELPVFELASKAI